MAKRAPAEHPTDQIFPDFRVLYPPCMLLHSRLPSANITHWMSATSLTAGQREQSSLSSTRDSMFAESYDSIMQYDVICIHLDPLFNDRLSRLFFFCFGDFLPHVSEAVKTFDDPVDQPRNSIQYRKCRNLRITKNKNKKCILVPYEFRLRYIFMCSLNFGVGTISVSYSV